MAEEFLEFLQEENAQRRLVPTFFAQSIYILYAEGFALLWASFLCLVVEFFDGFVFDKELAGTAAAGDDGSVCVDFTKLYERIGGGGQAVGFSGK